MTEKERYVMLAQTGRFTIRELCADFGISRKTGHKYLLRYAAQGRPQPSADALSGHDGSGGGRSMGSGFVV